MSKKSYEVLRKEVHALQKAGRLGTNLSPCERADWAWGNTKLSNRAVTRKMAARAAACGKAGK